MIEIVAVLILIIAFVLVIVFFDYRHSRPLSPDPGATPDPGETSIRAFSWDKPGISDSLHLNTTIHVRTEAYRLAKEEFMQTSPSKTYMTSEEECFHVAEQQIIHPDFGKDNYELKQVASYLSSVANSKLLSDIEYAGLILSFTQEQCIPYSYDEDSTGYPEYFRFPLETIYNVTGDCDCKAILACSLFKTLGFRVAFALMPGHAAISITLPNDDLPFANFVLDGKRWFYCETTGDYWNPGVLPDGINPNSVKLKEI